MWADSTRANPSSNHRRAWEVYRQLGTAVRPITTNYVLAESYTWARYKSSHRQALAFRDSVAAAIKVGRLELVWVTPEQHESGWEIFERYSDQVLSFTDCVSAVIARERNVDYVFSFDSDFSILGFDVRPGP